MNSNTEQFLNLIQELEELSDQVQNSCSQVQNLCSHTIHNYYDSFIYNFSNYALLANFTQSYFGSKRILGTTLS
jgi:hypothetical protein